MKCFEANIKFFHFGDVDAKIRVLLKSWGETTSRKRIDLVLLGAHLFERIQDGYGSGASYEELLGGVKLKPDRFKLSFDE